MKQVRVTAVNGRKIQAGGKWLTAIGNRAVVVGDLVWADGKCVYGHIADGGGDSNVPASNGVTVPVLSNGNQYAVVDKKGYSPIGTGESHDGMTHNKSRYGFVSGENVLDADIDGAGNILTLCSGKYEYKTNIGYFLKNYDIRAYRGDITYTAVHFPYVNMTGNRDDISFYEPEYRECYDCEIPSSGVPTEENVPVVIGKKGEVITNINLRELFPTDSLDSEAFQYAEEKENLMAQAGGFPWPPGRPCPEKSLHSRTIKAVGGKVDSKGNWSLIVEETANVTFFPWLSYRNPEWSLDAYNLWAGRILDSVRRDTHRENLSIVGGTVKSWFKGTASVTNYYLVTANGKTRLARKAKATVDYVKGVLFMQITDGVGRWEIFADNYESDGDAQYGYIILGDCLKVWAYTSNLSIPYQGGYWWQRAYGCIMSCVDTLTTTIGWNVNVEYYSNIEILAYCRIINMDIAPRQDGTFTKEQSIEPDVRIPLEDGFYGILDEKGENITVYTLTETAIAVIPWKWECNISCSSLGKGNYLVGIHGGELWLCSGGEKTKFADRLSNFRLRKMRNISKWRKEVNQQ